MGLACSQGAAALASWPAAAGAAPRPLAAATASTGRAIVPGAPPDLATLTRPPFAPDSGSLAVYCGALIDGVSERPRRGVTLTIRSGHIAALSDGRARPADLPLLDLGEHTCLPGLIDMHTHLVERPEDIADLRVHLRRPASERRAIAAANAAATLLAGFTSVRSVGNYAAWADRELRDEIDGGRIPGPRMQVSGFYLTIPGGGGDLLVPEVAEAEIPAHLRAGVARGAAAFRRAAGHAVEGGADVLKVIASGAVLAYGGVPGGPEMNPRELAAVVEVAHAAGRRVAAHAHGARSIRQAILAGVDTIEHASLIDAAGIELAHARGVALAMDVHGGDYIDSEGRRQGWPEEFLRKNLATTAAQRRRFTRAHAAGAPIVFATDAGVFPHGCNARQFPLMVELGMSPMEAIRSATSIAARHMGWADRVGRLAPGLLGDLIAVRGDPLGNVHVLQHVEAVIKGGLAFALPPCSAREH